METKIGNKRFKRAILDLQCSLIAVHFGAEQETKSWASGRYELTYRAFPEQNESAKDVPIAEAQRKIVVKFLQAQPDAPPVQIARLFGWTKAEADAAWQAVRHASSRKSTDKHRNARPK